MGTHHAIAVVTVILVGIGLKLTFFSAPTAAADVGPITTVSIDVADIHRNANHLPVENFHDMTFVFSNGD
jgi:hypothetical protein